MGKKSIQVETIEEMSGVQLSGVISVVAEREYMNAKSVNEKPLEFVMARKEYNKENRNDMRKNNAISFLSSQEGFQFWFYKKIGNKETAVFTIADKVKCRISKAGFLADYKKVVGIMRKFGAEVICNISETANGNIRISPKETAFSVSIY